MSTARRVLPGLPILVGITALVCGASPASAQWGMGFGWGWGGFGNVPSPTAYLNEHSLVAAGRAPDLPTRTPYANNPNSYINRIRDNGFVPHYAVDRRAAPAYRPQVPVAATTAPSPALPLGSFFDASPKLVWPSDAPTSGDLNAKRGTVDLASLAVLQEKERQGMASLSSAAFARQKLLDYGQPALLEIQAKTTPRIADTFHLFLLSLYESLAQAASPPEAASGSPPQR